MSNIFPILTGVIIFIFVLTFFIRRSNRIQDEDYETFWEREKRARLVPPKDLGTIAYLNVPIEKFSFGSLADSSVQDMEREIEAISKKPLLNLTGKTNTELRETYGAPNLEAMKEIGDDFDRLTVLLTDYAQALFDAELIDEAIPVLEYSIFIKTDVSKSYTLLGDCYFKKGQARRIETLKEQVVPLNLLRGKIITDYLDGLIQKMQEQSETTGETLQQTDTEL